MTIDEMKTRAALYDFLDVTQATLNRDYLVRKDSATTPLQDRVQALVNEIMQFQQDLNNGVIG